MAPVAWAIGGTDDLNRDGNADIIETNTVTDESVMGLLNMSTISADVALGIVPMP